VLGSSNWLSHVRKGSSRRHSQRISSCRALSFHDFGSSLFLLEKPSRVGNFDPSGQGDVRHASGHLGAGWSLTGGSRWELRCFSTQTSCPQHGTGEEGRSILKPGLGTESPMLVKCAHVTLAGELWSHHPECDRHHIPG
jgi:hypothetical protein